MYNEYFHQHNDQLIGVQNLVCNLCPAAQVAVIVKVLNMDCHIHDEMDLVTAAIQQAQLGPLSPTLL